jgi:hypothetical protein
MKKEKFQTTTKLSAYQIFSDNMIEKMAKHYIITTGQLLGATKGLTEFERFAENDDEIEMIEKLRKLIPSNVLEAFSTFSFKPPTGLLTNQNQNNHENTE